MSAFPCSILGLTILKKSISNTQVKNSYEDHAEQVDKDKVDGDDDPTCLLAKVRCFKTGGVKLIKIDITDDINAHVAHNNNGEESCQCANSPE